MTATSGSPASSTTPPPPPPTPTMPTATAQQHDHGGRHHDLLFWLLGYQFSPRIAEIGGARFWRIDPKADYGPLNNFASHKVRMGLIAQYWDDLLRLAGSLKLGLVQAGGLMRTLQTHDRPTPLARALEELGRIIKTLYMLRYIDDEAYRRRILTQLNRGEGQTQLLD